MNNPKLDLIKEYKTYYTAKTTPQLLEFEVARFLSIEGKGEPGGEEFTSKIGALYPLAFGVKNLCKKEGRDFSVPKSEGLWWVDSDKPFLEVPRKDWRWKLLIRLPDFVDILMVERAKNEVFKKKGIELIREIGFELINEGKCVQVMHKGPYSTEPETIERMRAFMREKNLIENGLHHEIYLSDPTRTAPEKMKTILRQPVKEI